MMDDPLSISIAVASVVVPAMAALAFRLPELYEEWFYPLLYVALAVCVSGGLYCAGVTDGMRMAFDAVPRSTDVFAIRFSMSAPWTSGPMWFLGGYMVFFLVHVLFGYIAHRVLVRQDGQKDQRQSTKRARKQPLPKRP